MKQWNKSKRAATSGIYDVDCTTEGKELCERVGVQGYPTIKYGDPDDLQDYEGERSYDAIRKFAKENLKPRCGVNNIDLCDDEKKAQIEGFMNLPLEELETKVKEGDASLKEAEETFTEEVKKLQERYEELEKEKTEKQKAIKDSGLGLMTSVLKKRSGPKEAAPAEEKKEL